MATPRSPYVCIGDSLLGEPWPRELKTVLVLLSCHMHVRWRTDRRLTLEEVARAHPLDRAALYAITGRCRTDVAEKLLERLADVASTSFERRGDVWWISWPKWAEYNKIHSRSQGPTNPVTSPSASASSYKSKKGARAPVRGREKSQSAPTKLREILDADAAHEQRFHEARAQLKAEEDRDYSVAEIEARMAGGAR